MSKPHTARQTGPEFLLHTFRQLIEKIQKLDASIEVLKGALSGVVERDLGVEAKATFRAEFAQGEQLYLEQHRAELDQMMETLRTVLQIGSLPQA